MTFKEVPVVHYVDGVPNVIGTAWIEVGDGYIDVIATVDSDYVEGVSDDDEEGTTSEGGSEDRRIFGRIPQDWLRSTEGRPRVSGEDPEASGGISEETPPGAEN